MGELDGIAEPLDGLQLFLDEVLDRLDVMIRSRFDLLHAVGVCGRELMVDGIQLFSLSIGERRQLVDLLCRGQRLDPRYLDPHAVADECVFAEQRLKMSGFCGVAAIDWRDGEKRACRHLSSAARAVSNPASCSAVALP